MAAPQIISLGIGSPSSIAYFILFGLSPAPDVVPPTGDIVTTEAAFFRRMATVEAASFARITTLEDAKFLRTATFEAAKFRRKATPSRANFRRKVTSTDGER